MDKWHQFRSKVKVLFRDSINRYFATIIFIIGTTWILIDAAWTIVNIYDYYNNIKSLENSNWLWLIIIILPVVITAIYLRISLKNKELNRRLKENNDKFLQNNEIIQFHRNIIEECFDDIYEKHNDVLVKDIESAYENENWEQVIKIGKYGARMFLMLARYDLRIKYGGYVIKAAEVIEEPESIAMGYIDCIGWSYVCQKKYEEAINNINKGLDYISNLETKESVVMKCKANRHLVGIALKQNSISEAKKHRDIFEKYSKKLKGRNKKIMKASLYIINGDIVAAEKQDYESAKILYGKAYELYKSCNDLERTVKVNYKLGLINEKMGQNPKALKSYLIGYWMADRVSRIDEKLKNCQGICSLISSDAKLLQNVIYDKDIVKIFKRNSIKYKKDEQFYIDELECLKKKIHT